REAIHEAGCRTRNLPCPACHEPVADIETGVAPVELRMVGVQQTEIEIVVALAERRAQFVLRMGNGVSGREPQSCAREASVLDAERQAVVQRSAAVGAAVDRSVL